MTCFEGGDWLAQEIPDECVAEVPLESKVEDFESGDPVGSVTVELYLSDDVTADSDLTMVSDESGNISGTASTCTPTAYRTSTDDGETKITFQAHNVFGSGDVIDDALNSVSEVTYRLIPSLLGITPDVDKGIVAGRAYDCADDESLEGAQVVVKDADGNIPDDLVVRYFYDDFPNRNQEYTSADGLWVAINVPVGDWSVEAYVADGAGGHTQVGASQVYVYADSINISSIYTGYGDGVRYPASCEDCTGGSETGDTGYTGSGARQPDRGWRFALDEPQTEQGSNSTERL
jgi:hypothetical protein